MPGGGGNTSGQAEVSAKNKRHTVLMSDAIASAAKMLAEPTRAAMLLKLMGGRAVPAGELAMAAHVSPQTASEHLARLAEEGFVTTRRQGRHRYYELARVEVAYAVESLMVLSSAQAGPRVDAAVPVVGSMEYARTCYAHLAGWLGVAIADGLQRKGYLVAAGRAYAVTDRGREWFDARGIAVPRGQVADMKLARQCLDWTERRPHVAGTLGVSMYRRFMELGWMAGSRNSRVVRVTLEGRKGLERYLGVG
jgi:DNA-binding transcriptional ArsR family regulator